MKTKLQDRKNMVYIHKINISESENWIKNLNKQENSMNGLDEGWRSYNTRARVGK